MNELYQLFIEPWTHAYFLKGAVAGSTIAIACAVLGCYIILRKMAFIGDAMSHALLPGVGVGYLVMNAIIPGGFTAGGLLIGALVAALLTSVCISCLSNVGRLSEDTAIGIIYTGLFAAGVVILTRFQQYINIDLNHFFQGDIYGVSWADMWLSAIVGSLVLGTIILFYRQFTLVSFDFTMAASIGLPTRLIDMALTIMIALVCVAGISMVGVIMIVGLLITPAALAYMLTDRLPRMMFLAALFGVLSVVAGLYFSEWVNASGGGSIMFTGFLLFLAGLILAPKYGVLANWLRRQRLVPQSDIEDVLKAALASADHTLPHTSIPIPPKRLHKVIGKLLKDGLLKPAGTSSYQLTDAGQVEASHIQRSHQLWEAHLIGTGMSPAEAHNAAERLEHLHGRDVLDRFDNELNHPLTDSHGVPIPGESEKDENALLTLSLLRQGDKGTIIKAPENCPKNLKTDTSFELISRNSENDTWTIKLDDNSQIVVTHELADYLVINRQ